MKLRARPAILAGAVLALVYLVGYLSHQFELPPYGYLSTLRHWWTGDPTVPQSPEVSDGKFYRDRRHIDELTAETRKRLASLGYLSGYEPATGSDGVVVHVPELASERDTMGRVCHPVDGVGVRDSRIVVVAVHDHLRLKDRADRRGPGLASEGDDEV